MPETTTHNLRKALFSFFSIALLVLALSITAAIYLTLSEKMKKAERDSLMHISEIRSMAIAEWSRSAKDLANQITSRTKIREELEKFNERTIDQAQLSDFTNPKLQDAMSLSDEILGILRLDKANRIIAECGYGTRLSLKDFPVSAYIHEKTAVSEPMMVNGCLLVIVSAPIISRIGKRQGTDLVMMDPVQLKKIATDSEQVDGTVETIVGYRSGDEILPLFPHSNEGIHSHGKEDLMAIAKDSISRATEGETGFADTGSLAVAYHPVEESTWGVAVTKNQSELYAPIYRQMVVIGCLSVAIYFIILFGFSFLLKPLAGRILMHTSELEQKIREKTEHLEKEIVERKKAEIEKEKVIAELRDAMREINTLGGLLPICSNCKKIRDDKGYWNQIESYVSEHTDAEFSHSICPECVKKLYPGLKLKKKKIR